MGFKNIDNDKANEFINAARGESTTSIQAQTAASAKKTSKELKSRLKRQKAINLYFNDEENELLRTRAKEMGMTVSGYIRFILFQTMHSKI